MPNRSALSTFASFDIYCAIERFNPDIWNHVDHPWRQVGRCVYCGVCEGVRLYQGNIPYNHPAIVNIGGIPSREAREMRDRWGMDDR